MFTSADAMHHLTTEPTPEAIHREEYLTKKEATEKAGDSVRDHSAAARARLLRAQVVARVGSFFA